MRRVKRMGRGIGTERVRYTHPSQKASLPMTALLHTSTGDAADSNSNESSGTDISRTGIGSPIIYPPSFLFVLYTFHNARISYRNFDATRHSNHKTQQPIGILQGHRNRNRSEHHRPLSGTKGGIQTKSERNNNTNIGK